MNEYDDIKFMGWKAWLMQPDAMVNIIKGKEMTDEQSVEQAIAQADADLAALDAAEAAQPNAEEENNDGGEGQQSEAVQDSGAGEDQAETESEDAVAN